MPTTDVDLPGPLLAEHLVPPGAYWSGVIRRHATLRIIDVDGAGSAALLAYNACQPSERYNAPDTTKVQNMIHLSTGWLLLSDLGRVLLSITDDTCGHHETLCGATTAATIRAAYGEGSYLALRNGRYTNDRDNFTAALGRHGLDRREIVPNVNLFSRVEVADDGALVFVPDVARPGSHIDLRAEMDVLVVLSATPHVLDQRSAFQPGPLQLLVCDTPPPADDDLCRTRTEEARRAFANTDAYVAQLREVTR
ncbi:MAG: urea carboxylase-associated family protein [Acidimicrobiales bacterium]